MLTLYLGCPSAKEGPFLGSQIYGVSGRAFVSRHVLEHKSSICTAGRFASAEMVVYKVGFIQSSTCCYLLLRSLSSSP